MLSLLIHNAVMFYVMQNVLYYFCLQCSMVKKKQKNLHSNKRSVHYHVDNNMRTLEKPDSNMVEGLMICFSSILKLMRRMFT